jgi:hypothetical protein
MTRARDTANTQENIGGSVAPFVAGKNKVINGDFAVNQRNFTSYTTVADVYNYDRFVSTTNGDGTVTFSPQVNTSGNVPGTPYQMRNFLRCVTTGQTTVNARAAVGQRIEGIETLAGQTATISFWAKAATGTPKIAFEFLQRGDATVNTYAGQVTINTSWTRYSISFAVPSLSGVTLTQTGFVVPFFYFSAGSDYNSRTGSLGIQSNTFDIWGIQLEQGSVATPFTTATGTVQGELAACQRYYIRTLSNQLSCNYGFGTGNSATQTYFQVQISEMRTTPTVIDYSALEASDGANNTAFSSLVINSGNSTARVAFLIGGHASGITQYRPYLLRNNASTSGYLGLGAEL